MIITEMFFEKNGKEIQARYYWNYVLSLEKADKDLKIYKKKINKRPLRWS